MTITSPKARLKMLETPNCSVKPTALSARMAEVTKPKPIARVTWFIGPLGSAVQGRTWDDGGRVHGLGGGVVVVVGERPAGAVVLVEDQRAAGAHVLDGLAGLEGRQPVGVAVDHGGSRRLRGDLGDEAVVRLG